MDLTRLARAAVLPALLLAAPWLRAGEPAGYGEARQVAELEHEELDECSGIACGSGGLLWTHNDSGDTPRVFAIDHAGRHRGVWALAGAQALDWEDMTSFVLGGRRWLLLADTGDNDRVRPFVTLYLAREPTVPARPVAASLPVARALRVRYPDGPHDCEAVGVDAPGGLILLVTKDRGDGTLVFSLPLEGAASREPVAATPLGRLDLPKVTALDVSPDGRRAIVLTYTDAHLYERREGEGWAEALRRAPLRVRLPRRRQGEAVCFGEDGRTLYLTSEKRPAPLLEVPWRDAGEVERRPEQE